MLRSTQLAHVFITSVVLNTCMRDTITLDEELIERIDGYREEGQSREEFVEELLNIYESGRFMREGYSE